MKHPFEYHRPDMDQVARIETIRAGCKAMYDLITRNCPSIAERTLALRKLEEVSMWANKSIVMEPDTPVIPPLSEILAEEAHEAASASLDKSYRDRYEQVYGGQH